MSLALGATSVIHLDNRYWLLDDDVIKPIDKLDGIEGVRHIYSDFGGAFQAHEMVPAPKRYAHVVLEKQLRQRGDTDDASTVIPFYRRGLGKSTVMTYCALPSDEFTRYRQEHEQHLDHSLTIPMMSLLFRFASEFEEECVAVVLQHGLHLDYLVLKKKQPIACARITSAGANEPDWVRVIDFLTAELNQLEEKLELTLGSLQWLDWDPDEIATTVEPIELLRKGVQFQVESMTPSNLRYGSQRVSVSLPAALLATNSLDAITTPLNKLLYLTERSLPWFCAFIVAISIALFGAGYHFNGQIDDANKALNSLTQGEVEAWQDVKQNSQDQSEFVVAADLVRHFDHAAEMPSLASMLSDIRLSTPSLITIIGISLDNNAALDASGEAEWRLIVEGFVSSDFSVVNQVLQQMITALKNRGYEVQDNGLVTRDEKHLIQLEIRKEAML